MNFQTKKVPHSFSKSSYISVRLEQLRDKSLLTLEENLLRKFDAHYRCRFTFVATSARVNVMFKRIFLVLLCCINVTLMINTLTLLFQHQHIQTEQKMTTYSKRVNEEIDNLLFYHPLFSEMSKQWFFSLTVFLFYWCRSKKYPIFDLLSYQSSTRSFSSYFRMKNVSRQILCKFQMKNNMHEILKSAYQR